MRTGRYHLQLVSIKGEGFPATRHAGMDGEQRYSSTHLSPLALDAGGRSTPRPESFTPRKEPRYLLYRRLCGPQGLSGRLWRIENRTPLLRFDPRTVQPLTGNYTDMLSSILIYQHSVLSINRASCADECARMIWTHG